MRSTRRKDDSDDPPQSGGRNPECVFHEERRKNKIQKSAADAEVTEAMGTAERDSAVKMVGQLSGPRCTTVGAEKLYDTRDFVADLRALNITPHVTQNDTNRRSAIDGQSTCHEGYAISRRVRKRIEEAFG